MNNQINEKINAGIDYFLIALLLLTNNAVYAIGYTALSNVRIQAIIVVVYLPLAYINLKNTHNVNYFILFMLLTSCIVFFMLFLGATQDNSILSKKAWLTFFLFLPTVFCYFYSRSINNTLNDFLERAVKAVTILAIFSTFCWLVFSIMHLYQGRIFFSTWSGANIKSFFGVYFETQQQKILNMNIPRNTSIYPEAPMFAYVLATTLVWNVFLNKKMSKMANYALMITLLTTFSSTGIAAALFTILCLVIRWSWTQVKNKKIFRMVLLLTLLVVVFILSNMLSAKAQSLSYVVRQDDLRAGMLSWLKHPFFGNGYQNELAITSMMASWRHVQSDIHLIGYSSGIFTILSNGGLYLMLFYVGPIILSLFWLKNKALKKSNIWLICGMMIMLFMLIFSIVPYTAFTWSTIVAFYVVLIFKNIGSYRLNRLVG